MRWIRRITFIIGLLILLLILILAVVVNKPALLAPVVNDLVSTSLNRPFEIKGAISVSIYPKVIVDAQDIYLGNPDWSDSAEMVTIETINAIIDPKMFFSEQAAVPELYAEGIKIILEKNATGHANWQFETQAKTQKIDQPFSFSLPTGEVGIKDLTFQYRDTTEQVINATISNLELSLTKQSGLQATLAGSVQQQPLTLSITSNTEVAANQAFPLTGLFDIGGAAKINLDGHLGWPLKDAKTRLKLTVEGKDLQKLGQLFSIEELASPEPYHLSAIVDASEQGATLSDVDAVIGEFSLAGDLGLIIEEHARLTSDIKVSVNNKYKDLHIKMDVKTDPELLNFEKSVPIDGQISLNDVAKLNVQGKLGWPLNADNTDLNTQLKGDNFAALGQLLDIPEFSIAEPYHIATSITASEQGVALNNMDAVLGPFNLAGKLNFSIDKQAELTTDLKVTLNDQYKDLLIKMEVITDADALETQAPISVKSHIILNDVARFDLTGTLGWPLRTGSTDLDAVLRGDNLAQLGKLFNIPEISREEAYHLSASVDATENRISLSNMSVSLAEFKLAGDLGLVIEEDAKLKSDFMLTVNENYQNLHIIMDLTTDLDGLNGEAPIPLEGQIKLNDVAQLELKGQVGWPLRDDSKTKIQLALKGKSLKKLGDQLSIPQLAKAAPYQLNGLLELDNKLILLNKISSSIGKLKLTGNLSWQQQPKPKLTGLLTVNRLDDEILSYFQAAEKSGKKPASKESEKTPEMDWKSYLADFETDIKLIVNEIKLNAIQLNNINSQTKIKAGKAHLSSTQNSNLFKSLNIDLAVDLNKSPIAYQLQAKANNVFVDQAMKFTTAKDAVSGDIAKVDLTASGIFPLGKAFPLPKATLKINNAKLSIKQQTEGPKIPVLIDTAQLVLKGDKQNTIQLVAKGNAYELPLALSVTTDETVLTFMSSGKALPVSLDLSANKSHLTVVDGQLKYDSKKKDWHYQMQLNLKSPNVKNMAKAFKQQYKLEKPLEITTVLIGNSSKIELEDIDFLIGGSKLQGSFSAEKPAGKWQIISELTADKLELTDLRPEKTEAETEAEPKVKKEKLLSDEPFDTDILTAFDADFDLDLKNVSNHNQPLGDFGITTSLKDGVLMFKSDVYGTYSKKTAYQAQLKAIQNSLDLAMLIEIEQYDYGSLLAKADIAENIVGIMDARLEFHGRGESASQMVTQGTGTLHIFSGEGLIPIDSLNLWGGGLITNIIFPVKPTVTKSNNIHCAAAKFILAEGVIQSHGIVLDTIYTTIGAQLQVKLPEERLKGIIQPKPKKVTIVSIDTPVTIGGTLVNPTAAVAGDDVLLTPLKMVVGFYTSPIDLVSRVISSDDKNPCEAVLAGEGKQDEKGLKDVLISPVKGIFNIFKGDEASQ